MALLVPAAHIVRLTVKTRRNGDTEINDFRDHSKSNIIYKGVSRKT